MKLHAVGGFALLVLFPYTRLVHVVTYPLGYLWRPYQVVIWNRRHRKPAPAPSAAGTAAPAPVTLPQGAKEAV